MMRMALKQLHSITIRLQKPSAMSGRFAVSAKKECCSSRKSWNTVSIRSVSAGEYRRPTPLRFDSSFSRRSMLRSENFRIMPLRLISSPSWTSTPSSSTNMLSTQTPPRPNTS